MKTIVLVFACLLVSAVAVYQFRQQLLPVQNPLGFTITDAAATQAAWIWPPEFGRSYPNLELVDQAGNLTRLSEFAGRIILVEPIGMPCPACQAFCGGHQRGGFGGVTPQRDLPALHDAARDYGGFDWDDERIVKVYLLLYDFDLQAPTPADANAWAKHFGLAHSQNQIVLAGHPAMISPETYRMIPGLQLIDRQFQLVADSTKSHRRPDDLYRELLPKVWRMLRED